MNAEIILEENISSKIYTIRGVQVMLDKDLAVLYEVETKRLNEQVKRNPARFPSDFMFQLNATEWESLNTQFNLEINTLNSPNLRSQNATKENNRGKHRKYLPYVFTEQGVAGLSGVLKSKTADKVHVEIMRAFVTLRRFILENASIFQRIERIETKLLENDSKFELVFNAIESQKLVPNQGIFFDGQVFDAYKFASDLIRTANESIILIDNFIDENTLTILSKKAKNIKVIILTKAINKQISLDVAKANEQYYNFEIKEFSKSHDRFLIIDEKEIYHLGASLKDLGKKWFAFSKMEKDSVENIIKSLPFRQS